ncbi:MAG: LD-carboxypeptidase [Fimbriimonadaceae bacterium]|nr:LD-carboxypeptidase [Fimbriimonadaceae bacterium]
MMAWRWPLALPPGGTIGVPAPSGPVVPEQLDRGVAALQARGYRVKLAPSVLARWHYLAGDDATRAAELQALWADPEVDAVWCARGGYGLTRLLDRLDWTVLQRPLPLIGYSDITALQLALLARVGLISYSGPMVASGYGYGRADGVDPETSRLLWPWLEPGPRPTAIRNPDDEPLQVWRPGSATGPLVGGCLTLVANLVGTPYLPSLQGAVLLLEDVDERDYRIDRYLSQLRLAGVVDQISGLVLGEFTDCFDDDSAPLREIVTQWLGDRDIPVLAGLRYGHLARRCTVPLGAAVRVNTAPAAITLEAAPGP